MTRAVRKRAALLYSLVPSLEVQTMGDMNSKVVLKAEGIVKVYPNGVVANKDVNLEIVAGEIHALIGENGAGKSTLMKILFGMEQPEKGKIYLNGQEVTLDSPKKAIDLGIGMVHQHFMLVESLTIAENIVLGKEPKKNGFFLDRREMLKISSEVAEKYNFSINVEEKIENVSVGVKQETEILKALVRGAKILILDEPTAVLTPQETKNLFEELRNLKKQGHTIIFISHKLNEIMEICDRVTIMRHGVTVETKEVKDTSPAEISSKMVGRDVVLHINKLPAKKGGLCLEAKDLCYTNKLGKMMLDHVSFKLYAGEIVSVAGVEGNGQSELAEILSGMKEKNDGEILIENKRMQDYSPKAFREKGVVYIPEDRMSVGSAERMSIRDNIFACKVDQYLKKNVFLDESRMEKDAKKWIEDFQVLCFSSKQKVNMLSGGNIQKVVAARELTEDFKIIIAEQPTRGIDAGTSELIRRKLIEFRDAGAAVLLISADLNEVFELSDKCVVMWNGKINAYFEDTAELTEEELGFYMLGVKNQSKEEVEKIWR